MTESIDHLRETIADLMRWIATERLEATVIGGVAAGLQGQPRLTEGVDAVVLDADLSDGPRLDALPPLSATMARS